MHINIQSKSKSDTKSESTNSPNPNPNPNAHANVNPHPNPKHELIKPNTCTPKFEIWNLESKTWISNRIIMTKVVISYGHAGIILGSCLSSWLIPFCSSLLWVCLINYVCGLRGRRSVSLVFSLSAFRSVGVSACWPVICSIADLSLGVIN